MTPRKRPYVKDRRVAIWAGLGLSLAGSLLLYDAYDHRNKTRPFAMRFLPGA
jgi:hypothetical protein